MRPYKHQLSLKTIFILLIFSCFALFSNLNNCFASKRQEAKTIHFFGAFGNLYTFGSARVGGEKFEIGLLTHSFLGIASLINAGSVGYFSFGTGLDIAGSGGGIGIYAGAGVEFFSFWIVDLRCEMSAVSSWGNYTEGQILVGANLAF